MTISINGSGTITGLSAGGLPDASVSASDLASGAAVSNIGVGGITSNELATAVIPIGVGQTWQDVSASRVAGTTYTNTTGRPITVSVTSNTNTNTTTTVNGVVASWAYPSSSNRSVMVAIVPSGSTYVVSNYFSGAWSELR